MKGGKRKNNDKRKKRKELRKEGDGTMEGGTRGRQTDRQPQADRQAEKASRQNKNAGKGIVTTNFCACNLHKRRPIQLTCKKEENVTKLM